VPSDVSPATKDEGQNAKESCVKQEVAIDRPVEAPVSKPSKLEPLGRKLQTSRAARHRDSTLPTRSRIVTGLHPDLSALHHVLKKATAMMTAVGLMQESLQGCVPHQLEMTVQLRDKELELQQARAHGQAVTERLQDVEAELIQWRSGKRHFVPGVIDVEADAVTSIEVFIPGVFTPGSKRPLDSGGGSLATLVKIKKEKLMVEKEKVQAEDDREDYEERLSSQTLFTDFLQGKLDELKNIALVAGADRSKVESVIQRSYARQDR
jgi:hypothetical protein